MCQVKGAGASHVTVKVDFRRGQSEMPRVPNKLVLALDTETTGVDLYHGARPFLVTTYDGTENQWWEWPVDPITRKVKPLLEDLEEIQGLIRRASTLVLQNGRFDVAMLRELFHDEGRELEWDWGKAEDTLIAGHLLASNHPHDLTSMVAEYLGVYLQPYEDRMKAEVLAARKLAGKKFLQWRLAKKGLAEMPSARGDDSKSRRRGAEASGPWKFDSWLPGVLAKKLKNPKNHPWWNATPEYANSDSASTWYLWQKFEKLLKERGYWKLYRERMKLPRVVLEIERIGVTVSRDRAEELETQFSKSSEACHDRCVRLSGGLLEKLPKNGTSNALKLTMFGGPCTVCKGSGYVEVIEGVKASCDVCRGGGRVSGLGLRPTKWTKKGQPSIDKFVLDDWIATLPKRNKAAIFVHNLRAYRRRQTALGYIESYKKFWLPWMGSGGRWTVLHPSLNITGTDTLRFSSSNPNSQQFSKQEIAELGEKRGRSPRYMLGPAPGREWWSLDAENIELRIPAYEAGEQAMIDLFERPDDPPYYGSNHLLFFDTLHPEMFAKHGRKVKEIYGDTWYQWTKNGDFAVQYGAMAESGTADRAYHVDGAQEKIDKRLTEIKRLGREIIKFADKHGYVETMPDKTVDSNHGYPLRVVRGRYGKVKPTVPLNYHVQGTAMWWMSKAMIRVQEYLDELNGKDFRKYYIVMQVHDELVLDFPAGYARIAHHPATLKPGEDGWEPWRVNLLKIRRIKKLMEKGGDDIGVPTSVSVKYHPNNWGEGVSVVA